VAPATDPLSGQPESKAAVCAVSAFPAAWHGFAVGLERPEPDCAYWARSRCAGGWRVELAGTRAPADWEKWVRTVLKLPQTGAERLADPARGIERLAFRENGRLVAALFVSPGPVALARDWVSSRLGEAPAGILAGQPGGGAGDPGPTVCACMGVGVGTILAALEDGRAQDVDTLGDCTGAGTSCGSCRPELAALVARARPIREAAE
jgi:assimilatory nitrate reductase catalytic subunit